MIDTARSNPIIATDLLVMRGPVPPKYQNTLELDDTPIKMTFTMTKMGIRSFWQLSFKDERHQKIDPNVATKILKAFYPNSDYLEVPSVLYPGIVLQFIKFLEPTDDPATARP